MAEAQEPEAVMRIGIGEIPLTQWKDQACIEATLLKRDVEQPLLKRFQWTAPVLHRSFKLDLDEMDRFNVLQ